jgi:hypothetical protein
LYGVVVARGAKGGFVVTSGPLTQEAREFALECKVELIDGQLLAGDVGRPHPRITGNCGIIDRSSA